MISKQEALLRVSPSTIDQLIHPVFEEKALTSAHHLTQGLPASPGAATGEIVFTAESAKEFHALGKKVILVRQETSPEDIEGMVVSQAIVTSHGGMTSHAAVVARGMGTCCVAGCGELSINEDGKTLVCGKVTLKEGDILSVDGTSGKLYIGSIPTTMIDNNDELQMFLSWADEIAQLTVRANAETIQDLKTAVQFGAKGIGLARTEHMFFGEERILEMRRLILSTNEIETKSALMTLLAFQEEDFYQMYQTIQDKPMIVRLLDPPMHEFLPKTQQEIEQLSGKLQVPLDTLTRKITSLQETNPMLGHRGCRLGITQPEIYKMQVEAVFNSAIRLAKEGMVIKPEIMIPLIAEKAELVSIKTSLCQHIDNIFKNITCSHSLMKSVQ